MAGSKSGISAGDSALVVIGLIIIIGFGTFFIISSSTTSQVTTTQTESSSSPSTITLIIHGTVTSAFVATSQTTGVQQMCTAIFAISYMYCPSPLRISAYGEPGASPTGSSSNGGSWNFTVTISSNSVTRGQSILLVANLTNEGSNYKFNEFIEPFINPSVTATNGTQVWAWDPPQVTRFNVTMGSGETISQDVSIPTPQLLAGESYRISVTPLSVQFPTPNNYTFTFQFSVR